jgi:AbiV family abortive infection protein
MNNLDITAIEKGMVLCCNQATQLIIDGDLLLEHKRYPTAFSVYQLASEESSKINILERLAIEKRSGIMQMDIERGRYFRNLFHSHHEKIKIAANTDRNFNNLAQSIHITTFRKESEIRKELDNPRLVDIMKQGGFYVNLKDNKFIPPSEIIGKSECEKLREETGFRHSRHKETMEYYLNNTDFFVKQFVDDLNK